MTRAHIATHAHYSLYLDEATQPEEVTQSPTSRLCTVRPPKGPSPDLNSYRHCATAVY